MYNIYNDIKYAKATNHLALYNKYRSNGYGNALSMFEDGRIRKNKIVGIYQSGVQEIYRVITNTGEYIDCTMNHKFPTPNGKKKLSELKVGDVLYVKGNYEVNRTPYRLTNGNFIKNTPQKGQKGFQHIENGNSYLFNKAMQSYRENCTPCQICDKEYSADTRFELHHKDFDRTNNKAENLQWLCASCHKKEHYKKGRTKIYEKGVPTVVRSIKDITFLRKDMTYDIEMEDPAHTFISDSGLVTSNSHSLAYAYDSLYGAYLKSHYPLEYYTIALNMYRDDLDRTPRLIDELSHWGITLHSPKFRYSQSEYVNDRENNAIYKGIASIKFLNENCAKELYMRKDNVYNSFIDLLVDLEENSSINSKQIKILIQLDFFEEFGKAGMLLNIYNEFAEGQFKYKKTYCEKTKNKRLQELKELEFDNIDLPIKQQIETQTEYFGSPTLIKPNLKGYAYVISVETKHSPKLMLYGLATGKIITVKTWQKVYNKSKCNKGDIIGSCKLVQKFKSKKVGEEWVSTDELEWWLEEYQVEKIGI